MTCEGWVNSAMDNMKELMEVYKMGLSMKGFPPTLSANLDDYEFMQYFQKPLKSAANNFRILINVRLFEPHEIEIYVLERKIVEIRAKHGKRQNSEGLWMTRDCNYTYELPPDVCGKELHAEWSRDNYLLIQSTSCDSSSGEEAECDRVRLVPEHVQLILKPVVELSVVRDMIEDVRDKASHLLRYIRFHTQNVPDAVKKGEESENLSSSNQPTDESQSSDGIKTESSGKDSAK